LKRPFLILFSAIFAMTASGNVAGADTQVAQAVAGGLAPNSPDMLAAMAKCFEPPVAPPANVPAAYTAFINAAAAIGDYTVTVHETDETDPPKVISEDRVLHFKYAKPCYGRVDVISGRLAGSAAQWQGGHKLKGHLGGEISHLKAIVPDTDPKTTDVRGLPMYAAFFPWIIDRFNEAGTITAAPGPAVGGVPTDVITVTGGDPKKQFGFTKNVMTLSSVTHLPLINDGYTGDKVTLHAEFSDYVINPGLPITAFQI
jgi:hypothetical protein